MSRQSSIEIIEENNVIEDTGTIVLTDSLLLKYDYIKHKFNDKHWIIKQTFN